MSPPWLFKLCLLCDGVEIRMFVRFVLCVVDWCCGILASFFFINL